MLILDIEPSSECLLIDADLLSSFHSGTVILTGVKNLLTPPLVFQTCLYLVCVKKHVSFKVFILCILSYKMCKNLALLG